MMLNTTTHNIDGKEIKEYLGVVTGEAISGSNPIVPTHYIYINKH